MKYTLRYLSWFNKHLPNSMRTIYKYLTSCIVRNHECQLQNRTTTGAHNLALRLIPGPSGLYKLPIIGLLFHFKPFGRYSSSTFHHFLKELNVNHGSIVRQRLGFRWMIFLFDPSDIQRALHQSEKYPVRSDATIMNSYAERNDVSLSLAFQDGEKWANLRKPTQEKIQKISIINKYIPALTSIVEEFVDQVGQDGEMKDTVMDLTRMAIENAGMFCFNKRMGCIRDAEEVGDIVPNIIMFLECLGKSYDMIPAFKYFPTPFYKVFEKSYTEIRRQIWTTINESMEKISSEANGQDWDVSKQSLLQSLLLDPRMSSDHVHSVIIDLFIAGIDATANSLAFVLYNVSKNPEVQEKLHREISQNTTKSVEQSPFSNMPYMKACIKESLRLFPPLRDGIRRILTKDMVVAGFHIPKGNSFVMCTSIIGLNEKYFHKPLEFRPERWLREGGARSAIHPFAVLPFGFGPRSCIGQRFAELQMHICLTELVQKWKLSLSHDSVEVGHTYKLFATPDRKFSITLEKR